MFSTTIQKLGAVRSGSQHKIQFPYEDIDTIFEINLGCGCTSAYHDPNTKTVVVQYTAQPVPDHLRNQSQYFYKTTKSVHVVYLPKGEKQNLSIELKFEVTVND